MARTMNEIRTETAQKNIAASQKRIDRLNKTLAKTSDEYEIRWIKDDIASAEKDLARATDDLAKFSAAAEEDRRIRESIQTVPAIHDFMDKWEERVRDYYARLRATYEEKRHAKYDVTPEALMLLTTYKGKKSFPTIEEAQAKLDSLVASMNESIAHMQASGFPEYNVPEYYRNHACMPNTLPNYANRISEYHFDEWEEAVGRGAVSICRETPERVAEIVHKEREAKEMDFILRIQEVTGVITDAKGVRLGMDGTINGIVVGEKATAKVWTIGAGGYNIQCYHFRVLVKKI